MTMVLDPVYRLLMALYTPVTEFEVFTRNYLMQIKWEVVMHAGCNNEKVIATCESYSDALTAMDEQFTWDEQDELGVDILKNGSTDY